MWILDPIHLSTSSSGSSCDGFVVALAAMAAPEVACVHRRRDGEFERARFRFVPPRGHARPIGGRACDRAGLPGSRGAPLFPGSELRTQSSVHWTFCGLDRYPLSPRSFRETLKRSCLVEGFANYGKRGGVLFFSIWSCVSFEARIFLQDQYKSIYSPATNSLLQIFVNTIHCLKQSTDSFKNTVDWKPTTSIVL